MVAPDGETALALATENKPDIVLLDIMMPGMDGREVCRRLREVAAEAKIIYLTAKVESTGPLHSKHLRGEADALIVKPATTKRILTKIESLLHSTQEKPAIEGNSQPVS